MLAVFRADADAVRGGGHVVRCAALAQQLQRLGWHTALVTAPATLGTASFAVGCFDELVLVEANDSDTLRHCWPTGCEVAVVDHYEHDARHETALRPWACRILAIDDLGDRTHDCD
ncbi:MAG: hypothetical protein JO128_24465, partial [Alphaproteobacteria bacterium]|nr:hypothetical protein [Alphaproteobacteria bacterium]